MTRDYLPFNFPGDKSYVSELLTQAVNFRYAILLEMDGTEDQGELKGLQEKLEAAQEMIDTLMLWLNS